MWVNMILIILAVEGVILFYYGLQKQSQLFFFLGITSFFIPVVYFIIRFTYMPLVPVAALIITYIAKRKITLA